MDEDSDEESDEDSNNDNSDEDSDLDDEAEDSDVSNEAEDEDEDSDVSVSHMLPRSRIARKTIAIMKENHIARHNPHKKSIEFGISPVCIMIPKFSDIL